MALKVPEEWQFLQKLTKEELQGLLFGKCTWCMKGVCDEKTEEAYNIIMLEDLLHAR